MSGTRWSARELEMLHQITTDHPPSRVPVVYNCWAAGNGFPMRARTAIRWQIYNQQIADKATGSWVSAGYICRILGISSYLPQQWTNRDRIPCYRDSQGRRFFHRRELARAARERPWIFSSINADRLFLLLEDRELADSIAASYPTHHGTPRPVRAIETGWLYPSKREAARRVNITPRAISYSITTGGTAAGYHWAYA